MMSVSRTSFSGRVLGVYLVACVLLLLGVWMPVQADPAPMAGLGYANPAAQVEPLKISAVRFDEQTKTIRIQADQGFSQTAARNYSVLKLPNPNRMIIDIPDAQLVTKETKYAIKQGGIDRVEFSETRGTFYNAVRATIFVDDDQTLWKLNIAYQDQFLLVNLNSAPVMAKQPEVPPAETLGLDIPAGRNIIEDAFYRDDRLHLRAKKGSQIVVKNRFILRDPNRLVLDLANAAVVSRELLKPITVNDPGIRQIRMGQFDEETVRIVVDTDMPETFQVMYPAADKNLLVVSPYLGSSIATLPRDVELGSVDRVLLDRKQGETTIRIITNRPMVHRVMKQDEVVYVDLLNAAANPGWIQFNAEDYPELKFMKLERLTADQPNSKLVVNLKNKDLDLQTELSEDGRVLELVVTPRLNQRMSKAPFPARIVIDAGHGGKDHGAIRENVREKDMNLALALMVKQELEARGFKVYMTRSTDKFLPLPEITAITNRIHPDLFISIHHNSSTNPATHGIETYYYHGQGLDLARKIHSKLISNVAAKDNGVRRARFYVINHTPVPAVLCEVGYVSNVIERNALTTMDRKKRTAYAISEGVVEYLRSKVSAQKR